jgi:hypothetical protein
LPSFANNRNKLDAKDGATVFVIALNLDRLGRSKEALALLKFRAIKLLKQQN